MIKKYVLHIIKDRPEKDITSLLPKRKKGKVDIRSQNIGADPKRPRGTLLRYSLYPPFTPNEISTTSRRLAEEGIGFYYLPRGYSI